MPLIDTGPSLFSESNYKTLLNDRSVEKIIWKQRKIRALISFGADATSPLNLASMDHHYVYDTSAKSRDSLTWCQRGGYSVEVYHVEKVPSKEAKFQVQQYLMIEGYDHF